MCLVTDYNQSMQVLGGAFEGLAGLLGGVPDNAFQRAKVGESYDLRARGLAVILGGLKLLALVSYRVSAHSRCPMESGPFANLSIVIYIRNPPLSALLFSRQRLCMEDFWVSLPIFATR